MAKNNSVASHASQKPKPKAKKRSLSTWLVRNAALLIIGYVLLSHIPSADPIYAWLKNNYLIGNMSIIKQYPDATYDQKMAMKLGNDYNYILFLRDNTPSDAIIYYPSAGDFRTKPPVEGQPTFEGKLIDKLTVVRALYPRKVITADEYGKTSWSKKITHVAVVNRQNLDKLPYSVGENYINAVLPVKLPVQSSNTTQP